MSDTEQIKLGGSIDHEELGQLIEAFYEGHFHGVIDEHEGATQTFLYEVPHGHIGVSIGCMPRDSDLHISVSEWHKEKHHESDRWVWHRSKGQNYE